MSSSSNERQRVGARERLEFWLYTGCSHSRQLSRSVCAKPEPTIGSPAGAASERSNVNDGWRSLSSSLQQPHLGFSSYVQEKGVLR